MSSGVMEAISQFLNDLWMSLQGSGQGFLPQLGLYALLVVMVALEGPLSTLLAAGAASTGLLNPILVGIASSLGNVIADSAWYSLGYYGKFDWLLRRRRWFGFDPVKLEAIKRIINRHAVKLLVFAKATDGLIVPVLVATGVARVPVRRWFPVIFIANILISIVMVSIGYWMASSLFLVRDSLRYAAVALALVFVLAAGIFLRRWLSKRDLVTELDGEDNV